MAFSTPPLAERLRPQTLDDYIGQDHLVAPGKPLYLAIHNNSIPSMILWGPPGVGKTTLARIIANTTRKPFFALSAVAAGKTEMKQIVEQLKTPALPLFADARQGTEGSAILFLDEIHRFNKAQQDYLLPFVEDGTLTLIGATTENPSFEVISALLSRLQIFVLRSLSMDDLRRIVQRGAQMIGVELAEESLTFLAEYANGDARASLNLLDNAMRLYAPNGGTIRLNDLKETLQNKLLRYDKGGEEHYNTISAFIKSMRAGQVDAALYYLARMIDAGEDPRFIARRMVIFASEDVGMALPTALVVANEVFRAVETVGLPEAQINLAHGVAYLASAPKDRRAYDAYFAALEDVKKHGNLEVPLFLRNAPTQLMKELGYGSGPAGEFLPAALAGKKYFGP